MNEIREVGRMLAEIQRTLDAYKEHDHELDQLRAGLNRAIERFKAFPKRVADQGPFATAADAEVVLTRECNHIIAALTGN